MTFAGAGGGNGEMPLERRQQYRLLGCVVGIEAPVIGREGAGERCDRDGTSSSSTTLILDDGTGLIPVSVPESMMRGDFQVSVGKVFDVVATWVDHSGAASGGDGREYGGGNNRRGGGGELRAEQLVWLNKSGGDASHHAEALRWTEISHARRRFAAGDGNGSGSNCCYWGYPSPPADPCADDVYNIIQAEAAFDDDGGNGCNGEETKAPVSLEDLAKVLDMDANRAADIIEELQVSGQIYRNRSGRYLPL